MDTTDLGRLSGLDAVARIVGDVAGLELVDMGCGEGALAKALAARGARVTGVDPFMDPAPWTDAGTGAWRILRAPAPRTGLPDASADLVLFVFSFHHVPAAEMAAALAEARRLLRPAGRLYVSEPLPEGPGFEITRLYHDETVVRAEAQAALARFDTTLFAARRRLRYGDPRKVTDWASYSARALANMRFNPFTEADVLNDRVKATFEAVMARTGGDFVQPVLVDLFERPRAA